MMKVGDKVRCIKSYEMQMIIEGKIYTIKKITKNCIYPEEYSRKNYSYYRNQFELVDSKEQYEIY